jgi:UDP-N-acetylmuramoyl-tripeptide--D-alanyl-D-alanine ligase
MTFGTADDADVSLRDYSADTRMATFRVDGRLLTAHVPGGGLHRATSLAAVIACLAAAEQPFDIARDLPDSIVPEGRGSRISVGGVQIIDDSYNANPTSMAAALQGLAAEPGGRKMAILGEMLELGDGSVEYHRRLAEHCRGIAKIACVGQGMTALWDELPDSQRFLQVERAADVPLQEIVAAVQPGDVVLVKGSNRVFWADKFVGRLSEAIARRFDSR